VSGREGEKGDNDVRYEEGGARGGREKISGATYKMAGLFNIAPHVYKETLALKLHGGVNCRGAFIKRCRAAL
jgi:hypothetical protein